MQYRKAMGPARPGRTARATPKGMGSESATHLERNRSDGAVATASIEQSGCDCRRSGVRSRVSRYRDHFALRQAPLPSADGLPRQEHSPTAYPVFGPKELTVQAVADWFSDRHADEYDRKVTPKWVGTILRNRLHLRTEKRHGVFTLADSEGPKLDLLFERFGVASGANDPTSKRSLPESISPSSHQTPWG